MININNVIGYIKRQLGSPFVSSELDDKSIEQIMKYEALLAFEKYVPDVGRIYINKHSKKHKIKKNLYWVIDPQEREVFAVQSVEPDQTYMFANAYPYTMPVVSFESLPQIALQMTNAETAMRYGKELMWYQESVSNQVWIFSDDGLSGRYSISYTRSHAPDLSTIGREYASYYNDIALAYVMMTIGHIRSKYGTIGTPVGDIQLDTNLLSEGKELLSSTLEKLDKVKPIYTQIVIK